MDNAIGKILRGVAIGVLVLAIAAGIAVIAGGSSITEYTGLLGIDLAAPAWLLGVGIWGSGFVSFVLFYAAGVALEALIDVRDRMFLLAHQHDKLEAAVKALEVTARGQSAAEPRGIPEGVD